MSCWLYLHCYLDVFYTRFLFLFVVSGFVLFCTCEMFLQKNNLIPIMFSIGKWWGRYPVRSRERIWENGVWHAQKQPLEVFYKKRSSYKFCKLLKKTPVPESFFLFFVFSFEFCEISENTFFIEHHQATTSACKK